MRASQAPACQYPWRSPWANPGPPPPGVPGVQVDRGAPPHLEGHGGVEQRRIAARHAQMLGPHLQPQVAGKTPGAVAVPREVAWLLLVGRCVNDGAGQFAVVGPGAAVEVV